MSTTLLDDLAGLAPTPELRDRRLARVAGAFAEPLARALEPYMSAYNQPLVEPIVGRTGWSELLKLPAPPAGSSFTFTVTGDSILKPLSVACRLTTSAAVGNRTLALEYLDDGGVPYDVFGSPLTIAAGSSALFVFHAVENEPAAQVGGAIVAPLAPQFLYPTATLALTVGGIQAGDQIDNVRISAEQFMT